ncbi:MAG: LamG-like jellyroll fold domain-containing protein [Opitutaceae bacterium]
MRNAEMAALVLLCAIAPCARADSPPVPAGGSETVWRADEFLAPGGIASEILGRPKISRDAAGPYALFDGRSDGFVIPSNPLAGWGEFTVEVLLNPDPAGPQAQRYLHVEDAGGSRLMMELRLTAAGQWALDTFLLSGASQCALLDEKRLHPAGGWHWAALRYSKGRMESFVDGRKELEGRVDFKPMKAGRTSVGVRLNRVYWYMGAIREIIFHPVAVADSSLHGAP